MALDDYMEPEVGIAVAVTALVLAPPVRRGIKKALIRTLAFGIQLKDTLTKEMSDLVNTADVQAHQQPVIEEATESATESAAAGTVSPG